MSELQALVTAITALILDGKFIQTSLLVGLAGVITGMISWGSLNMFAPATAKAMLRPPFRPETNSWMTLYTPFGAPFVSAFCLCLLYRAFGDASIFAGFSSSMDKGEHNKST